MSTPSIKSLNNSQLPILLLVLNGAILTFCYQWQLNGFTNILCFWSAVISIAAAGLLLEDRLRYQKPVLALAAVGSIYGLVQVGALFAVGGLLSALLGLIVAGTEGATTFFLRQG